MATVAQDAAIVVDVTGVLMIELPAVTAGCAVGGLAGCAGGELFAWGEWSAHPLNDIETSLSGASFFLTLTDDLNNNGWPPGENTYTSGASFIGGLVQPPSGDLIFDVYGSAYNHGYVNGVTDIMSGGSLFK